MFASFRHLLFTCTFSSVHCQGPTSPIRLKMAAHQFSVLSLLQISLHHYGLVKTILSFDWIKMILGLQYQLFLRLMFHNWLPCTMLVLLKIWYEEVFLCLVLNLFFLLRIHLQNNNFLDTSRVTDTCLQECAKSGPGNECTLVIKVFLNL